MTRLPCWLLFRRHSWCFLFDFIGPATRRTIEIHRCESCGRKRSVYV